MDYTKLNTFTCFNCKITRPKNQEVERMEKHRLCKTCHDAGYRLEHAIVVRRLPLINRVKLAESII